MTPFEDRSITRSSGVASRRWTLEFWNHPVDKIWDVTLITADRWRMTAFHSYQLWKPRTTITTVSPLWIIPKTLATWHSDLSHEPLILQVLSWVKTQIKDKRKVIKCPSKERALKKMRRGGGEGILEEWHPEDELWKYHTSSLIRCNNKQNYLLQNYLMQGSFWF